jgi:hypothetical protein
MYLFYDLDFLKVILRELRLLKLKKNVFLQPAAGSVAQLVPKNKANQIFALFFVDPRKSKPLSAVRFSGIEQ